MKREASWKQVAVSIFFEALEALCEFCSGLPNHARYGPIRVELAVLKQPRDAPSFHHPHHQVLRLYSTLGVLV